MSKYNSVKGTPLKEWSFSLCIKMNERIIISQKKVHVLRLNYTAKIITAIDTPTSWSLLANSTIKILLAKYTSDWY